MKEEQPLTGRGKGKEAAPRGSAWTPPQSWRAKALGIREEWQERHFRGLFISLFLLLTHE